MLNLLIFKQIQDTINNFKLFYNLKIIFLDNYMIKKLFKLWKNHFSYKKYYFLTNK